MEWTRITPETLPERGAHVLVGWEHPRDERYKKRVGEAFFRTWDDDPPVFVTSDGGWGVGETGGPSHWAPVPEPPSTDAEQFPDGKLYDDDEGVLAVKVGTDGKLIMFRFPKPVVWFAFPPEQALDIAERLLHLAVSLGVTRPVTFTIGGTHE